MKIIPIAFTERELSDFSSVLDLAVSRLSRPWSLADSAAMADFRIIAVHGPEEFSRLVENVPEPDRIIVYGDDQLPVQACWFLTRRENSPPRVSELIALFQQVEQSLEETASAGDIPGLPNEPPRESVVLDAETASDPFEAEEPPVSESFGTEEQPVSDLSTAEFSNTSASPSAPSWRERLIRMFSSRRENGSE